MNGLIKIDTLEVDLEDPSPYETFFVLVTLDQYILKKQNKEAIGKQNEHRGFLVVTFLERTFVLSMEHTGLEAIKNSHLAQIFCSRLCPGSPQTAFNLLFDGSFINNQKMFTLDDSPRAFAALPQPTHRPLMTLTGSSGPSKTNNPANSQQTHP